MAESVFKQIKFTDADVVNHGEFISNGEHNPHKVRPFLLHDHGFVVCVVFASCLQDALDEAVDGDKLDRYQISQENMADYENEEGITYLGNASEPFDIESLECMELPNPKFSFCALFNAMEEK